MDELDAIQLARNPDWRATLQAYYDLQLKLREQPDWDGWVLRQAAIQNVDSSSLSSIHGKLIAFGMLKFDVAGRDLGVRYQLTHQGRRALLGESEPAESAELAESA